MITEDPEHVSILLAIVMINHLLTSFITSLKRLQDACLRSCLHCQGHNSGPRPWPWWANVVFLLVRSLWRHQVPNSESIWSYGDRKTLIWREVLSALSRPHSGPRPWPWWAYQVVVLVRSQWRHQVPGPVCSSRRSCLEDLFGRAEWAAKVLNFKMSRVVVKQQRRCRIHFGIAW